MRENIPTLELFQRYSPGRGDKRTEGSREMWEVIRSKEVYTVCGLKKEGEQEEGEWKMGRKEGAGDDRWGRQGQQKREGSTPITIWEGKNALKC